MAHQLPEVQESNQREVFAIQNYHHVQQSLNEQANFPQNLTGELSQPPSILTSSEKVRLFRISPSYQCVCVPNFETCHMSRRRHKLNTPGREGGREGRHRGQNLSNCQKCPRTKPRRSLKSLLRRVDYLIFKGLRLSHYP